MARRQTLGIGLGPVDSNATLCHDPSQLYWYIGANRAFVT